MLGTETRRVHMIKRVVGRGDKVVRDRSVHVMMDDVVRQVPDGVLRGVEVLHKLKSATINFQTMRFPLKGERNDRRHNGASSKTQT